MHGYRTFLNIGLLIVAITLGACSGAGIPPPTQPALPEACRSHCVTPWAQVLGAAPGDVTAYSNCNASCVVFRPNHEGDTYTGIQWQCVEYARRWLLKNKGVVYGDINVAADLWHGVHSVRRVADGHPIALHAHENGSDTPPMAGDLLIYGREYLNTGHVAVVTAVDWHRGKISVAEQNWSNQPWPGDHARRIDVIRQDGRYWVLDTHLIGWKRLAEDEEPLTPAAPAPHVEGG